MYTPAIPGKTPASKFYNKWSGPYRIVEKKGPVTFKIRELNGRKEHMVHADRLKPCKDPYCTPNRKNEESNEHEMGTSDIEAEQQLKQDDIDEFLENARGVTPVLPEVNEHNSEVSEEEITDNEDEDRNLERSETEEENIEIPLNTERRTRTREIKIPARYKDYVID